MRHALLLLGILVAIGCYRESKDYAQSGPSRSSTVEETTGTVQTNTDRMNPTIPTTGTSDSPTAAQASHGVHLLEYQIHMPNEVPSGRVIFSIENAGKENHAFEIEGNGIEQESQVLTRGNRTTMEVTLQPGTYRVYCPVEGHAEKGMETTLTVK